MLTLNPKINGGSPAAGIVKGMVKIYQTQPDKPVHELYHLAAKKIAEGMNKIDDPVYEPERSLSSPSLRG